MCGRFSISTPREFLEDYYQSYFREPDKYKPIYNAPPTFDLPVITEDQPNQIEMFRWGLIPSWAKDEAIGNKLINARAETILEKPSFRTSFMKRRCLVLADGFYEWQRSEKHKTPYRIQRKDGKPFAFAGIYDRWQSPKGKEIESFSIITCAANKQMEKIHDRMPVILESRNIAKYLNKNLPDYLVATLLKPYEPKDMTVYKVSEKINSPANNTPEVVKSIEER